MLYLRGLSWDWCCLISLSLTDREIDSEIDSETVHSVLVAQKANCILGSISRGVTSR